MTTLVSGAPEDAFTEGTTSRNQRDGHRFVAVEADMANTGANLCQSRCSPCSRSWTSSTVVGSHDQGLAATFAR